MTGSGRRYQTKPLQGVVICCTAVPPERWTRFAEIVEAMGGKHSMALTSDVTHLLVEVGRSPTVKHLTKKYKYVAANCKDVRVLQPAWLEAVGQLWVTGEKFDLQALEEEYKLPIFTGLSVCLTGFKESKDLNFLAWLQESIVTHGGDYRGNLTKDVTHLVANTPEGRKYRYAEQWNIRVVSLCWFKDCIDRGMVMEESLYHPFEEREKALNREAKAKALLRKRLRDENLTQEAPRKHRRTAGPLGSGTNITLGKPPQTNKKLRDGSSLTVKQMDSLKIPILKPGGLEPLTVDFSQDSNAIEVLRALAGGGWILLKRCTQVSADTAREDILSNKVVQVILNAGRSHGAYGVTDYHLVKRNSKTAQWVRSPNWKKLAEGNGISMIFCNHLGGTDQDKWMIQYDTAGGMDESGVVASVEADGTDILLIAGYLKFKAPYPQANDGKELDMAIVHFGWRKKASEASSTTS